MNMPLPLPNVSYNKQRECACEVRLHSMCRIANPVLSTFGLQIRMGRVGRGPKPKKNAPISTKRNGGVKMIIRL